jgi:histidine ammonia-lyase
MRSSERLERARALVRGTIPHLDDDRHMAPDLEQATSFVVTGALTEAAGSDVLPLVTDEVPA